TNGNGIELVRIAGTVTPGQFVLAAPITQGAIEYALVYLPDYSGSLDGFFLQSRTRSEFIADAAMLVAGQAMTNMCFRSGDLAGDEGRERFGRGWAKVQTGNLKTGADTGVDTKQDIYCGSGGIDALTRDNMRLGIAGGYGNTEVKVQTGSGTGVLEGDGGMAQAYGNFSNGPLFANVSLGYGTMNWEFDRGGSAATTTTTVRGILGSIQAGGFWQLN